MTVPIPAPRRLGIAIILAIVIPGSGHMYLGKIKRGFLILFSALGISWGCAILFPYPISLIPLLGFWVWQIFNVRQTYRRIYSMPNPSDSSP